MSNPFETIDNRLTSIESLLLDIKLSKPESNINKKVDQDEILNVRQASEFLGLAVPTIYSLTSNRILPHSKRGKKLYFNKSELLAWVQSGKRKTTSDLKLEAAKK